MTRSKLSDGELAALAARIQRDYDYDDRSGKLINKLTGRTVKGMKQGGGPYRDLRFNFNGRDTVILMHRAVWAWHNGCFPAMQLDHINGDKTDNRIENLREVSDRENKLNKLHDWNPNPETGLPSVSPKDSKGVFQTRIQGKNYHFTDPFEAFYHATLCGKMYR